MKICIVLTVLVAVAVGQKHLGPEPWDENLADQLAQHQEQEQLWEDQAVAGLDQNLARARPWTMEEGDDTRVEREVDQAEELDNFVRASGAKVEHDGKQYELPDDFDTKTINDETDVETILNDYEDQVDKEMQDGLAYITTNASSPSVQYRDCQHHLQAGASVSGVYEIFPWTTDAPFDVWCDFYTTPGEGWTLISRRNNGSVQFYRDYTTYQYGFGAINGDHWLGLENIRLITWQKPYALRVDVWDCAGNHRYAIYDYFALGPAATNYELLLGVYASGDAGDSLGFHRYQKFSTYDSDNDGYSGNCANLYKAGWWYNDCYESNLNGLFFICDDNGVPPGHTGMTWKSFGGYGTSLPRVEIKVRPYDP